jgi:hypothetical protein
MRNPVIKKAKPTMKPIHIQSIANFSRQSFLSIHVTLILKNVGTKSAAPVSLREKSGQRIQ